MCAPFSYDLETNGGDTMKQESDISLDKLKGQFAEQPAKPGISHWKRNVVIVVIAIVGLFVLMIVLYSFVFSGLSTPMEPTAQVQAWSSNCTVSNYSCSILLMNSGGASNIIVGCAMFGSSSEPTVSPAQASIQAGSSLTVSCQEPSGSAMTVGTQASGYVILASGGQVSFAGEWQ
jgi:hypothetical protein